jgi:aromatic ring-opening dioxygenase catalytic subunit (LigB family)
MYNIFDSYNPHELRDMYNDGMNSWPDDFRHWMHDQMANDLLDQWLETVTDEEYMERAKDIIESETYGYEDENGNEMLDFKVE